jgi:hypothetical protein
LSRQAISGSTAFFLDLGILVEDPKAKFAYGLTDLGRKLGKSLQEESQATEKDCWAASIKNSNFLQEILNSISLAQVVDQQKLKHDIAIKAGRGVKANALEGAKTIIDILEKSALIEKRKVKSKVYIHANKIKFDVGSREKLIFVIMAFSPDMEPVFQGIAKVAKQFGFDAKRVVDVKGDIRITDQIIKMINTAELIVVDLTHERPNVYFELGYARGLNKTVITLARQGTNVHFDVKDWRYIPYTDSRVVEQELSKWLEDDHSNQ